MMDNQVFAWTLSDGRKAEIVVDNLQITLENEVLDADGWKIDAGKKKIVGRCNSHLYIDGKSEGRNWNYEWLRLNKGTQVLRGKSGKKVQCFPVVLFGRDAERYEAWIENVIESSKTDEVKAFEAAQEEEKAKAMKDTAPTIKHDVEKERAYDMAHNEGGEGFNPYRLDSAPTYWTGHRTREEPIED